MNVRRAHMVSKGYLRAWADSRNSVDVIDLQDSRGFKTSVESATVVSYVYDPEVLTVDLEGHFSQVESAGTAALVKLREETPITQDEQRDVVAFLNMHLERGRYADQAKITTPALLIKTNGSSEEANLKLGDRLLLSRNMEGVLDLRKLTLEEWPWRVYEAVNLVTGDGAVLLWRETKDSELCSITFPLSPTLMLVIGQEVDLQLPFNELVVSKSRRWLVASVGMLTRDPERIAAARNAQPLGAG